MCMCVCEHMFSVSLSFSGMHAHMHACALKPEVNLAILSHSLLCFVVCLLRQSLFLFPGIPQQSPAG